VATPVEPFPGLTPLPQLAWSLPDLKDDPTMCIRCRAAQMLCGKPACPILIRYRAYARTLPAMRGSELDGSSPPGVFVGRFGYPKVSIGPLVTPQHGDTLLFDTPEEWVGRPPEEVVGFRTSLIRGTQRVRVTDAEAPGRLVEDLQTLAMSAASVEVEARFRRPPRGHLTLSDELPPYGPTAPIDQVRLDVRRVDAHVDRLHSDTDANARVAVEELYGRGVRVSRIQRAFSAGTLGRKGRRRFVPTRWSITAVDDLLGLTLKPRVQAQPELSEIRLYRATALDNRWFIAFLPGPFRYESIEAWYPHTLWNPGTTETILLGDHEGPKGRTTYASMGGCYYAARLAVLEAMRRDGRQGGALVYREVHPGELLPLGVWNVREHVRAALRQPPERIASLEELLLRMDATFAIPRARWLARSSLLHAERTQRRLEQYAS
jgi:DNA repair protein NreA